MKKLITANDIRAAHARGEQAMSVVLRASIITPEAREVAELLGFTITEDDGAAPAATAADSDKTESQRIRETILAQLPEGQFTESLVAQLMEKVMKEKQSLEQEAMQPGFDSVTGKGGIKVIDGSSVKFGRFDGAQPHCVGLTDLVTDQDGSSMAAGFMQWENAFFPWTLNYDEIDMVLEGELHVRHQGETLVAKAGGRHVHPERLQHRIRYPVDGALPVRRLAGKLAIAMNDFITEAWLRANHTLSEGGEIHLPADARLTPSARELLESRHLRVKFLDRQGRLFVEDDEQTPQPVHVLTSSDHPPQACCELCHQPVGKKPDTLTHLTADTLVAKNDPRLAFRAVLDSTIALTVWLQIELAEPWQPWLTDIRSRLGNIMRADALEEPLAAQSIAGFSEAQLHRLSHQPLRYLGHDHLVPEARHGRDVALLNLLRGKVREAEVTAAQVFITPQFAVQRADILQALNRLSSAVYVMMILGVTDAPPALSQLQQLGGEDDH
ncbi:cob(I)yrinic acid a,c-diamide adenosyltransferase [Klebsiella pneumoniae]|nr:cob(I)yrinic acid a,c-diamide adenosyltransferase [Klebsiella pneumoniae]